MHPQGVLRNTEASLIKPLSFILSQMDNFVTLLSVILKEYYEIVGEGHPLSGFFPAHADFFTEMHF